MNKIKHILTVFAAVCLTGIAAKSAPQFTLPDLSAVQGEKVQFAVTVNTEDPIKGFQCELKLPKNIDLGTTAAGALELSLATSTDHQLTCHLNASTHTYGIVVYSAQGSMLPAGNYTLLTGSIVLNAVPDTYFYQLDKIKVVLEGTNSEVPGYCNAATIVVENPAPEPPVPTGPVITITGPKKKLVIGEEMQLTAVLREDYQDRPVTWKSSRSQYITVDNNGVVTGVAIDPALGYGATAITATCDGHSDQYQLEVYRKDQLIEWTQDLPNLVPGMSVLLEAEASSGLPIVYEITQGQNICTIQDNELTILDTGDIKIKATQPGNEEYKKAPEVTKTLYGYTVKFTNKQINMPFGSTMKMRYTVDPAKAVEQMGLTWESAQPEIAQVDAQGNVTGIGLGTAAITLRCGVAEETCQVTITPIECTSVTLNISDYTLSIGQTVQLVADVLPINVTDPTVYWTSKNENVVTVDENGLVTAISTNHGNPQTIVTARCGNKTAKCNFKVVKLQQEITWVGFPEHVYVGDVLQLNAEATSGLPVSYSIVRGSSLCVLDGDKLTIHAPGDIKIRATQKGDDTYVAAIDVDMLFTAQERTIESIEITPSELTLEKGESATITVTAYPVNANEDYTFTSTNTSIATVEADGTVNAVGVGMAMISVQSSNASATCTVTVLAPTATAIILLPGQIDLMQGYACTLSAELVPEGAVGEITWVSSNPAVATVSPEGTVTSVAVGTTTVTASCGSLSATCTVKVSPIAAEMVTILNAPNKLYVGDTMVLEALVIPENTVDKTINWSTNNPEIASIDADGKLTALAPGTVRVTAETANGLTSKCTITVYRGLQTIIWDELPATAYEGDEVPLTAVSSVGLPIKYTVKSGDATIVGNMLHINGVGQILVKASQEGNDLYKEAVSITQNILAIERPIEAITLNNSEITLHVGQQSTLSATIAPSNATASYAWETDDENVAIVTEGGKVTAVGIGQTIVRAYTENVSAECQVTVLPVPATSVTLNRTDATIRIDETMQLVAIVAPDNATDKTVVWTSSDETIATVDVEGYVQGIAVGVATITAACGDCSAECQITVKAVECTQLTLSETTANLYIDETLQLFVTQILPNNTTDRTITWYSNDEDIAEVDENGVVTGLSSGAARIYATCGQGTTKCTVTVKKKLQEIVWDQDFDNVHLNQTVELQAYATSGLEVTYEVVAGSAITSLENGLLTLTGKGRVKLRATQDGDDKFRKAAQVTKEFYVTDMPIDAMEFAQPSWTVSMGESIDLVLSINPTEATEAVAYTSSDPQVALVDSNGKVTGLMLGSATITATTTQCTATCVVSVVPVSAESIRLSNETLDVELGAKAHVLATVSPANTTYPNIIWSIGDESIATIDQDGWIQGVALGQTMVTARCGEVTATCTVNVVPVEATSVTLDITSLKMNYGEVVQLSATVGPENTTFPQVEWISSNEDVVTVDEYGYVTAVGVGTAKVRAICGAAESRNCMIEVYRAQQSIVWDQDFSDVHVGEVITLDAEATSELDVEYEVSKGANLVTLNGNRLVVKEIGLVKIRARQPGNEYYKPAAEVAKEFTVLASGIEDVAVGEVTISIEATDVIVRGLANDAVITVYALDGRVVYAGRDRRISLMHTGAYVLVHPSGSIKFNIR